MTGELDARQEALLERAFTGELSLDSQELQREAEGSPEFRERLETLRTTVAWLDETGAAEREALSAARTPSTDARFERTLASLTTPAPRRRWAPMLWPALAGAAAVIALVLLLSRDSTGPDPRPDDGILLGESLELLAPILPNSEFGTFSWRADLPPGTTYRIEIRAVDAEHTLLHEAQGLADTTWQPTSEQLSAWPNEIRWEVQASLPGGAPGVSESAYASRSSD